MRPLFLFFLFLIVAAPSKAQWTGNPGAPQRVCSTNSTQYAPWLFSDGTGGTMMLWYDTRAGLANSGWIYAQHYSAAGVRTMPDTGKQVLAYPGVRTSAHALVRDKQNNFWMAWAMGGADSILLAKFDKNTLNPLWAKPKTIARRSTALFNIIGVQNIQMIATADSVAMVYNVTWMGGSTVTFVNRADKNGNRRFGDGSQKPGCNWCYGPFYLKQNSFGGFYIVQRAGNGLGAGVYAWRYNDSAKVVWEAKQIVGTPGLGYDFDVEEDGNGGFVLVWVRNGNDLMMTRIDSMGNFVFANMHKPVCDYTSSQDTPDMRIENGYIYVSWKDNRPPASNSDIYLQKMSMDGERVWNPNGRRVIRLNSYIPVPRITTDTDGNIIVLSHHSSTGFVAQKVRPDSTLAWPGYGLLIASGNTLGPFYEQFSTSPGPNGHTFVVWQGFNNKYLYIANLDSSGVLTDVQRTISPAQVLKVYPNPASTTLAFPLTHVPAEVQVLDLLGREMDVKFVWQGTVGEVDILSLKPGLYFLKEGNRMARFQKE